MKKIGISFVLLASLAIFNGCGSSSGNPAGDDDGKKNESSQKQKNEEPKTGIGYYKDSAVKGVSYVCGSKRGITDKQGKFIFEIGKDCIFSLADMKLKEVKASNLYDQIEIVEDNATVYTLLQTLDSDGNASNGITILPQVVEQLKKVKVELPASPAEVANVHNEIKNVEDYHGKLKTEDEAKAHVIKTQTEVTKKLLAGKTFYAAYHENNGTLIVEKDTVNQDATQIKWQNIQGNSNNGTADITKIDGKHVIIEADDGKIDNTELLEVTDKWVKFQDDDGEIKIFYFSEADAKASPDDGTSVPASNQNDLKALLTGNTWYIPVNYTYPKDDGTIVINDHVEQLTFKDNGTIHIEWQQKGEIKKSDSVTYEISGNQLHLGGTDGDGKALDETLTLKSNGNSVLIFDGEAMLYKDKSAAQAWLDAHPSQGNTTQNDLKALLTGKTFYLAEKDQNDEIKWMKFNTSVTSIQLGSDRTSDTTVQGNVFTIQDRDGAVGHYQVLENKDSYLIVKNTEGGETFKLYINKSDAKAALDGGSSDQNGGSSEATQNDLKALLAGKTVYKPDIHDGHKSITTFIFNENMTRVTGKAGMKSEDFGITTTANRFTFDYEGKKRIYELEGSQEDYLSFNYLEADSDRIKEHYRFYFDKGKAQAWLDAHPSQVNGGVNKTPSFSATTLSGKTLVAYKEKDNSKPSICFTFNADRSVKAVMKKSGTIKTVTASDANWQVVDGKLKFFTETPKYQIWTLMDENSGLFTYKQEWYNGDGSIDDSDTRTFRVLESCPTSELMDG